MYMCICVYAHESSIQVKLKNFAVLEKKYVTNKNIHVCRIPVHHTGRVTICDWDFTRLNRV